MIPFFIEVLSDTIVGKKESREKIHYIIKEFVDRLTGKKTLFQCIALQEWVVKFGGEKVDPLFYKKEYLNRLLDKIQ